MSNVIVLPKCDVCGARGCRIKHSASEIEVSTMSNKPYPIPSTDKKQSERFYEGWEYVPEEVDEDESQ